MSKSDQILLGEKLLKDEFDKYNAEANRLFEAQTIETDREKFVNNYLVKKGESLISKEKSNLLEDFKDKPLVLGQVEELQSLNRQEGESLLSKEKSNLLEEFKDNPLILSQLKEFYNS